MPDVPSYIRLEMAAMAALKEMDDRGVTGVGGQMVDPPMGAPRITAEGMDLHVGLQMVRLNGPEVLLDFRTCMASIVTPATEGVVVGAMSVTPSAASRRQMQKMAEQDGTEYVHEVARLMGKLKDAGELEIVGQTLLVVGMNRELDMVAWEKESGEEPTRREVDDEGLDKLPIRALRYVLDIP